MDIKSNVFDFLDFNFELLFQRSNVDFTPGEHQPGNVKVSPRLKKCRCKTFQVPQIKVVALFNNLILVPQTNKLVGWQRLR